jgi:AmmeMemoRadiSam system protein A
VEVQVPFIQTVLPGVPIVPVVIGGDLPYGDCKEIARAMARAIGDRKVLIVASSDMSHYPSYQDAYDVDLRLLDKVADFDVRGVSNYNAVTLRRNIPGLDCAMCGTSALVTVMLTAQELTAKRARVLPYVNSGDVSGERHRVVGYGAAVFFRDENTMSRGGNDMLEDIPFTDEERKTLFEIARKSIVCALKREPVPAFTPSEDRLNLKRGVFVTLTNRGRLRGCIGHFEPDFPLWQIVSQMAVAAATQDYRFAYDPVTLPEMDDIDIKISVLSELKKIDSFEEIEVGKYGIWIQKGGRGGTYLPEVATELGWDRTEFLEHCCMEKAGLPKDAWKKDADVFIYSSQILNERDS